MTPGAARATAPVPGGGLPWIGVAPGAPYFIDDSGAPWHPIGQNDAITWPDLAGLYRRRDLPSVERYLRTLKAHGVTCLRLMLEYAQGRHRYFERPAGRAVPAMVQLWDDLFALCEAIGLRILLTPLDTFWTWLKWDHHPWNRANGGPLEHISRALICGDTRAALKRRFDFIIGRWGGSGALFGWDLWNEIHPANAQDSADCFHEVIADLSAHVRAREIALHGRAHPQTVSLYGPELKWKPELAMAEVVLSHPALDFATIHIYGEGPIDNPTDTVRPALAMGEEVARFIADTPAGRPFLDTEHGPIHAFKDRRITLPEAFDDEMFRHVSWAHLAAGGAGGGMRWPNRHPHVLTPGMRRAQKAMAGFMPLIDWAGFARRTVPVQAPGFSGFACADGGQALAWLVRAERPARGGRIRRDLAPRSARFVLPLEGARARLTEWDTETGHIVHERVVTGEGGMALIETAPVLTDRAIALRRL